MMRKKIELGLKRLLKFGKESQERLRRKEKDKMLEMQNCYLRKWKNFV